MWTSTPAGPTVNQLPLAEAPGRGRPLEPWAPAATTWPQHSAQHQHSLLLAGATATLRTFRCDVQGPAARIAGSSRYAGAASMRPLAVLRK